MPTYESIKYKFSGAAVTGVLKPSNNLNDVSAAGTNANGNRTVSSGDPTGGSDGDIWLKVS